MGRHHGRRRARRRAGRDPARAGRRGQERRLGDDARARREGACARQRDPARRHVASCAAASGCLRRRTERGRRRTVAARCVAHAARCPRRAPGQHRRAARASASGRPAGASAATLRARRHAARHPAPFPRDDPRPHRTFARRRAAPARTRTATRTRRAGRTHVVRGAGHVWRIRLCAAHGRRRGDARVRELEPCGRRLGPAARNHRGRLHAGRRGIRPTRPIIPLRSKLFSRRRPSSRNAGRRYCDARHFARRVPYRLSRSRSSR